MGLSAKRDLPLLACSGGSVGSRPAALWEVSPLGVLNKKLGVEFHEALIQSEFGCKLASFKEVRSVVRIFHHIPRVV